CLNGDKGAFQVMSAFWQILRRAAESHRADIVLLDLGPNLGTINRAALIAADYVVVPLTPDLFSLQGLRNLGPRLRRWREDWRKRLSEAGRAGVSFDLPEGNMTPIGYVVLQHAVRLDRPTKAYDEWIKKIPTEYRESVLGQAPSTRTSVANDPECLALLKHYRSLMPLAQEARKPIFHLTAADGALGAHYQATADVRSDFKALATKIAKKANPT
ncbi:MAG: ParA family protein, partial [Candidatus Methylomirabilis sp.]|nr:ParA family protein [Deltaproteobacteria bacterium]